MHNYGEKAQPPNGVPGATTQPCTRCMPSAQPDSREHTEKTPLPRRRGGMPRVSPRCSCAVFLEDPMGELATSVDSILSLAGDP